MRKRTWNPYLAGALAGFLLVLSVLVSGHFLGASTTFARGASVIEKAVGIDPSQFEYFTTKKGDYGPGYIEEATVADRPDLADDHTSDQIFHPLIICIGPEEEIIGKLAAVTGLHGIDGFIFEFLTGRNDIDKAH